MFLGWERLKTIHLFKHGAKTEEGSNSTNYILPNKRPKLFIKDNGEAIQPGSLEVLHLEWGGFDLLRSRDSKQLIILILNDARQDKMIKVGWEVGGFFFEKLIEIVIKQFSDQIWVGGPLSILGLYSINVISPSTDNNREVKESGIFILHFKPQFPRLLTPPSFTYDQPFS